MSQRSECIPGVILGKRELELSFFLICEISRCREGFSDF